PSATALRSSSWRGTLPRARFERIGPSASAGGLGSRSMDLHVQLAIIGRVALGAFLGYILGLDRALRGKDAGDRTFSLVALGSAAFVALGVELYPDSADRVIQGGTAGLGFFAGGATFPASAGVDGA